VTAVGNQEYVALDDLAAVFQLSVREESGAITVAYRTSTIVLTPEQALASVAGRLISLQAPPTRVGGRWLVPLDFLNRALVPVYSTGLEFRRSSRLLIIGEIRVPSLTLRYEPLANAARLTIDATPAAPWIAPTSERAPKGRQTSGSAAGFFRSFGPEPLFY
jgi:hypothetical protein